MDLQESFSELQNWWEENREWIQGPLVVIGVLGLISILVLMFLSPSFLIGFFFFVLMCAAPFGGFYLGPQMDDALKTLSPYIDEMNEKLSGLFPK